MSEQSKTVIELRRPYAVLGLGAALFGLAAAFYAWKATTNDRGLILNGILRFDPSGADIFYTTLGALSAAFVALALLTIARYARLKTFRLVLGRRALTMPTVGLREGVREARIAYSSLRAVELHPPGRPTLLEG